MAGHHRVLTPNVQRDLESTSTDAASRPLRRSLSTGPSSRATGSARGTAPDEQYYAYGAEVLAVADGRVVSIQDGKPEETPNEAMTPKKMSDFGGNQVFLEIARTSSRSTSICSREVCG